MSELVCDWIVHLVRTGVNAAVAILGELGKLARAAGRLEDDILTRSKLNARTPQSRNRGGIAVPTFYSALVIGWFHYKSDANLASDPIEALQTSPVNTAVLLGYIALMVVQLRSRSR